MPPRCLSCLLIAGMLAGLRLAAAGAAPSPDEAASLRISVLTPHPDAIRNEFARAFRRWHQQHHGEPVDIEWRTVGGTSDALRFIQSEFKNKPDGIDIDLLFGGGQEPYYLLADKKFTQRYQPPPHILAGLPMTLGGMEIHDANFEWFGSALSSFGILQNTLVQRRLGLPLARQWEDLADPRLRGWVGAGDPRNSGTMNVMFEAFLQAYGWEKGWQKITEIAGNVRRFDRVSSTTAKDVTLGETAYAFAIDFYGFSQIAVAGRTNMTFALPRDFTAINADGMCILKGAPHLTLAQRFVDFVLSEEGQKLWFLRRGAAGGPQQHSIERMSVRPDFYERFQDVSNIEFSPFDLRQSFTYNAKLGRDRREVVAALLGALMVDTHPELQSAWVALVARGRPPAALREFGRMPVSAAQALQLAATTWKDPAARNLKKIEWQNWARQKYRRLIEDGESRAGNPPPAAARALDSRPSTLE